uniref:Uncharacterized protein n=1 Tax=Oryza nivara TaxID=4536 RepID=A0A0E0GTM6_ORYNI
MWQTKSSQGPTGPYPSINSCPVLAKLTVYRSVDLTTSLPHPHPTEREYGYSHTLSLASRSLARSFPSSSTLLHLSLRFFAGKP